MSGARGRRLGLGAALALAIGVVGLWALRPVPCGAPLPYRLGHLDGRFGLSSHEVLQALRGAEALWERAAGRDLFRYDPGARLVVNLVFDERQATTVASRQLERAAGQTHASHAEVGRSYSRAREAFDERTRAYEVARAAFQDRVRAYNAQVEQWNARGGAPPEARDSLEAERRRIEAEQRQLETDGIVLRGLADTLRTLADRGNALAETHRHQARTFNEVYGGRRFHKGEYDGRAITIYEFHEAADLTLVLAHELGHALGLGHVDDPGAVMHAVIGEQPMAPLAVAPADLAALTARCARR